MIKIAQGCLGEEELQQVQEAFEYGYFGHAHKVEEFEAEIASVLGIDKNCVAAVNTGTAALHLSLDAAGVGVGDEVLVPSLTFVATYQAISALGGVPISCDVYDDTLLLDIEDAESKITGRTKAIMPVHYCGNPCNMDRLISLKEKYGIRIIEDSAHIFKGEYKGKLIGSFGDVTCFSFDSLKLISCGEGGAVVSKDTELIRAIKVKRMVGMDRQSHTNDWKDRKWIYDVYTQGYRYHMSNINAAIGLAQLKKIDSFIDKRREICRKYVNGLSGINGVKLLNISYDEITPFMFIVKIKDGLRNQLMDYLKLHDIESAVKYIPSHLFTKYRQENESLPVTEKVFEEILEIPLHCKLTDQDVDRIIVTIQNFFCEEC